VNLRPAMPSLPAEQHLHEMRENARHWERKPLLQAVYGDFYQRIAARLQTDRPGLTVELGSGLGHLKSAIPRLVRTDIFPTPWSDRVENSYRLTFADQSVAHLILFDVFHHLQYPGAALAEFHRVLVAGGRLILFEPAISLLGFLVYGPLHHEPIGWTRPIEWEAPAGFDPDQAPYYSGQGNSTRIFFGRRYRDRLRGWTIVERRRYAAVSYVLSGGYRGPSLCPLALLPVARGMDRLLDFLPWLFATRLLVVLEKPTA
jgi:SAM-dependent methyltransferase